MALASHETLFDVAVDAAFIKTSLHKVPNDSLDPGYVVRYVAIKGRDVDV